METKRLRNLYFPTQKNTASFGQIRGGGYADNLDGNPRWRTLRVYGLVYIYGGEAAYRDGNKKKCTVRTGDLILLIPGLPQTYPAKPGCELYQFWMHFQGSQFDLLKHAGILNERSPIIHLEPVDYWLNKLDHILGESVHLTAEESMLRAIRVAEIVIEARTHENQVNPANKHHRWLMQAKELIEAHCMKTSPDWQAVAKEIGMSYDCFRKKFTARTGHPPSGFRAQRQIEIASQLLLSTDATNAEIADRCGFSDEYHFSKRFKQLTGKTPKQYRHP